MSKTQTGLDNLIANPKKYLAGKNVGLLVNHTSLAGDGRHSISYFLRQKDFVLKKIFAPEHGLYAEEQDMAEVADRKDPVSGLPVFSLYGKEENSLKPNPEVLRDLDVLIYDIQDIGSRYYTYIYTLANCMRICGEAGVRVVVCDRPNPINGRQVEGNLVGEACRSFVGQYPLPNRHGMTAGELARLFKEHFGEACDLTVVPITGWDRAMWHDQTGLTWVGPSPNMPQLETATVYPGMCMVEGTKLSEGRGTTLPFELFGAPWIDAQKLTDALNQQKLPGVYFRPHYFRPAFQKFAGEHCGGAQLHVVDRELFKPTLTGVAVIAAIAKIYPKEFEWRTEPYEFVSNRPAIDLLYGNRDFREKLAGSDFSLQELEDTWREETKEFLKLRCEFLIY